MATTFDDLPSGDQAQLLARLKVYGLDQTAITHPDLVVPGGATVHLGAGDQRSAVPARMITTSDLSELKRWIGIPDQLYTSGKLNEKRIPLPAPLEAKLERAPEPVTHPATPPVHHGPAGDRMANVHLAAAAYLFGNSAKVSGYKGEIEGVFINFQIPVWVFLTITVYPGATLQVSGPQNVLSAWKIVVYDGGTIAATGGLKTDTVILEKAEGTVIPSGPLHVANPIGAKR
jgi:hypothetical protein